MLVPLQGAAAARVVSALWSGHAGAAARCCGCQGGVCALKRAWWSRLFKVLLSQLVPLRGAAVRVVCSLVRCCQRCVRFGVGMLVQGATAGCRCKVLLESERCVRFGAGMLMPAAVPCSGCQRGVCALELHAGSGHAGADAATGCLAEWCVGFGEGMLVPLQGAAGRFGCQWLGAAMLVAVQGAAAGCCLSQGAG